MDILSFISIFVYILVPSLQFSTALDSISHSQNLTDGKILVSKSGTFALGFFSPGNSKKSYLGIWYNNIPTRTVVWVANRLNPINDSSGVLTLNSTGNLVLTQNKKIVWYTNSTKQAQNSKAYLLDSGNLVIRDGEGSNPEAYLWQSFDYPTDTMLPGMKLGWDLKNNLNRYLTAWKSPDDPSPGDFSWGYFFLSNYPESHFMKGTKKLYRTGPWNGLHFSGSLALKPNPVFIFYFFSNKDEFYYYYTTNSVISRLVVNETESLRHRYVWSETDHDWKIYTSVPRDYCDHYGLCGAHANCMITESPVCQCLKGFRPKSLQKWNSMDWSQGCVRDKPLGCKKQQRDGFIKVAGLKVPETTHTWLDVTMNLDQCREKCLSNCSCMAYTNSDIRGQGSGCALWFGDLIDIRQIPGDGQDLYIRMAASEIAAQNRSTNKLIIIVATTIAAISGVLLLGCFCICYRVWRNVTEDPKHIKGDQSSGGSEDDLDLPFLDLSTLVVATDNFSMKNKIGEGGFGPVYKGTLEHGQEVAVKRLSRCSGQGIKEFKNEVKLIAKLQHRNLVKLLGCCIHGQDKMLVYEYMPNGSLDSFIFDDTKGKVLNWSKRFHIICGIARGLLYLHQDSRLRIIHRDLKASNVLLDDKLNPKISDFGMARTFGGDQIEGNTNRVVGTYGYMAPEYAADGLFSIKSDVFSFGILLLEIISSKRNRGFYHADHKQNLINHAWMLCKEGRALELINQNIVESCNLSEALRCMHISLLCVQQHSEDRPTMSSVVVMLGSDIVLAQPKQPGFFLGKASVEANSSSSKLQNSSTNEITITLLEAR